MTGGDDRRQFAVQFRDQSQVLGVGRDRLMFDDRVSSIHPASDPREQELLTRFRDSPFLAEVERVSII